MDATTSNTATSTSISPSYTATTPSTTTSSSSAAHDYLSSLLNQNLRVTTTDGRLFCGQFKCTDAESNIVLAHTYEFRPRSAQDISADSNNNDDNNNNNNANPVLDFNTSRHLGLVVVPGHRVVRLQLERFASQIATSRRHSDDHDDHDHDVSATYY